MAAVGVGSVGAEGGDFGKGGLAVEFGGDQHNSEVCAYGEGAREKIEDDIGRGRSGYVVVLGLATEEQVANAAAGQVGLVALVSKLAQDGDGCGEMGSVRLHCFFYCRAVDLFCTPGRYSRLYDQPCSGNVRRRT